MNYVKDDYFLGHLLKQARKINKDCLTLDILENKAEPEELLTTEIKISIESWCKWFPVLVENSGSTMEFVKSATLSIKFDLETSKFTDNSKKYLESPFVCEIIIVDDRGKEYNRKHEGWWYPESE
ncbi:hypothetical protein [Flavobacterium undicola]|uniref:hypothetical protein n=1 Tax=Flavobacterium undicola TaxID=1932779 RepID=UPI0013777E22|nr:hypothetical protein [Flavobacterium undicola]MBA0885329.1 hypothetical protein [Flavobacterium undicola]